jgi:hypothetical protein
MSEITHIPFNCRNVAIALIGTVRDTSKVTDLLERYPVVLATSTDFPRGE